MERRGGGGEAESRRCETGLPEYWESRDREERGCAWGRRRGSCTERTRGEGDAARINYNYGVPSVQGAESESVDEAYGNAGIEMGTALLVPAGRMEMRVEARMRVGWESDGPAWPFVMRLDENEGANSRTRTETMPVRAAQARRRIVRESALTAKVCVIEKVQTAQMEILQQRLGASSVRHLESSQSVEFIANAEAC
ncbi:hypothetical protein K438DRAFT_1758152 [Mycena galopus ATCC 62051]|nr:hypothetical protein K438DRAFT_1758152 [Mycena galopus ATCC 62051]